jgi:hypothetical protein
MQLRWSRLFHKGGCVGQCDIAFDLVDVSEGQETVPGVDLDTMIHRHGCDSDGLVALSVIDFVLGKRNKKIAPATG